VRVRQIRICIRIRRILHMKSASDGCGYWLAPLHPYFSRLSSSHYCVLCISVLTVALLVHCCVCLSVRLLSSVTLCIVAKRCVIEQTILLRDYKKSYMRNRLVPKWMTFTFVLEIVSKSCQPLRDIRRRISRKPLEIEAWFQRSTNRKWHMDYQMVTWPMTSRDLESSNSCPNTLRAQYLENDWI